MMRSDLLLAIYFLLMVLFRFQLNPLKYLQMPIHSRKIHLECHHIQNGKKKQKRVKSNGEKKHLLWMFERNWVKMSREDTTVKVIFFHLHTHKNTHTHTHTKTHTQLPTCVKLCLQLYKRKSQIWNVEMKCPIKFSAKHDVCVLLSSFVQMLAPCISLSALSVHARPN